MVSSSSSSGSSSTGGSNIFSYCYSNVTCSLNQECVFNKSQNKTECMFYKDNESNYLNSILLVIGIVVCVVIIERLYNYIKVKHAESQGTIGFNQLNENSHLEMETHDDFTEDHERTEFDADEI